LPTHKSDFTGDVDGLVGFVNDNTVLINAYGNEDRSFHLAVMIALNNAGLKTTELPFNPSLWWKSRSWRRHAEWRLSGLRLIN